MVFCKGIFRCSRQCPWAQAFNGPTTVVESFVYIGSDVETQYISVEIIVPVIHCPPLSQASSSSTLVNTDDGETQLSGSGSKSRKHKRGRNEAINKLLEKIIAIAKD